MLYTLIRGWDATGLAGVKEEWRGGKKEPIVYTYKRALHYVDFMEQRNAKKFMEKFHEFYYVLGHCRASTVGATDDNNAHPFEYGNYALVHNGTVSKIGLEKANEEVDSAYIAATMDKKGEIETLEKLDGGYSLVWHNHADDTLNFARNDRKPMAMAFVRGRNELWYASEFFTLWNVLKRNDIEIDGPIFIPRSGVHYKFYKEDVRAYDQEGFKIYSPPVFSGKGRGPWPETVHRASPTQPETDGKQTTTTSVVPATNVSTSSNTDSPPSTRGSLHAIQTKFTNPDQVGIDKFNNFMEEYGLKWNQTLIATPLNFVPLNSRPGFGAVELVKMKDPTFSNFEFKLYQISHEVYKHWQEFGRVAITVRNFVADRDRITVACVHNEETQKAIEGSADMITPVREWDDSKDKPATKGGSKSGETAVVCINTETGEIIDAEMLEKDLNRFVDGPDGVQITWERFEELCSRNCGSCDCWLDPERIVGSAVFLHGGIICPECAKDEHVMSVLTGTSERMH
jgi:hypothetical protein